MDEWLRFDRRRNDDPYHAWMMHRRLSEEAPSSDVSGVDPLCPVFIKVHPTGEDTLQGLAESLKMLGNLLEPEGDAPRQVVASAYDAAHLRHSLGWIQDQTGELGPKFAYMQYYLVYVSESVLFETPNGRIPIPDDETSQPHDDKEAVLEIIYAGAGISDIVMDDMEGEPRLLGGAPRTALTVIDDSFAFLNDAFIDRASKTRPWRFDEIWFQDLPAVQSGRFRNGVRLDQDAVKPGIENPEGLSDFDLYRKTYEARGDGGAIRTFVPLDLSSGRHQPLGFSESHGTHVAARALQVFDHKKTEGLELSLTGVVLPVEVTENTSGSTLGSYLLAGIRQAMMWNDQFYQGDATACEDRAQASGQVPLVINFSYGVLAGMKDGTSRLNRAISEMIKARNGFVECRPTALVVPMGNSYETRSVAYKQLCKADKTLDIDWIVLPDDRTASFVEIYACSDGETDLGIDLIAPTDDIGNLSICTAGRHNGESDYRTYVLKRDVCGEGRTETYKHAAEWSEWAPEPSSTWTRRVFLALGPTQSDDPTIGQVPAGRWKLKITNLSGEDIAVLAMVQRDDTPGSYPVRGKQSFFDHPEAWQEGTSDYGPPDFPDSGQHSRLAAPMTHSTTGSSFAAIESPHVFVVGAGRGRSGDGVHPDTGKDNLPIAANVSRYAGEGPRRIGAYRDAIGPDYSGLADRSPTHLGVFAAGTNSATEVAIGGSSVAAPELSGLCAARPEIIVHGRDYLKKAGGKNPHEVRQPDSRFGLIKQVVE